MSLGDKPWDTIRKGSGKYTATEAKLIWGDMAVAHPDRCSMTIDCIIELKKPEYSKYIDVLMPKINILGW